MAEAPAVGWTVEPYERTRSDRPVVTFLESLDGRHAREAAARIAALTMRGNQMRGPDSKAVEGQRNLFELRGHQVRIFYMFLPGRRIVLLDGMIKKQDRIPERDLARVLAYQADVDRRGPRAP